MPKKDLPETVSFLFNLGLDGLIKGFVINSFDNTDLDPNVGELADFKSRSDTVEFRGGVYKKVEDRSTTNADGKEPVLFLKYLYSHSKQSE